MVDGVHGCVDHVVRHVVVHRGVLEIVTVPNLCVEEPVMDQVTRYNLVVAAVQVRL